MPFISDVTIRLRFQTCKIVDDLIQQGRAKNQKTALKMIFKRAKAMTGFTPTKNGYNQYMMFRLKYYNCHQEEPDEINTPENEIYELFFQN